MRDKILKDWDYRFPWTVEKLRSLKSDNLNHVFDIGSGNAVLKPEIEAMGLCYQAFDIVAGNGIKVWNIEQEFPYAQRPDAVIFLEVVEHLNNPWLGVKNIADILPTGGYLVLSTPNPAWSDSRVNMFRKGVLTMFTENDLIENHHVFTPWQHIIFQLLRDNGFDICACEPIGNKTSLTSYPFWSWKLPFRLFYRGLKVMIEKKDTDSIGALYGIVAKKVR